jgi:hypothetical protein
LLPESEKKVVKKYNLGQTNKMENPDVNLPDNGIVNNISPIAIFPEDKLYELREKIYVATGVPVQRQHIFWIDDNNSTRTTYKIKTNDGGEVYIDARNISKIDGKQEVNTNVSKIFNLELDKYVYDNIDNITIIAMDTFKTVEDYIIGTTSVIYLVDLADVIYSDEMRLVIANDKTTRNLLYKYVIYKYWPWITEDLFSMAVNDEQQLAIEYPQLAPNREKLEHRFLAESAILSNINVNAKNNLEVVISMAITSVATGTRINIRNLFDKIETTKDFPHVNAYINDGALKYNVIKHYIGTPNIIFPPQTRSGITFAVPINPDELYSRNVSLQSVTESFIGSKKTYLFLNIQSDGIYYIISNWDIDQKIGFDDLIDILTVRINPVIEKINILHEYIFMGTIKQLSKINKLNARYVDINLSLFWKHTFTDSDFKKLKDLWEPYQDANIVKLKPIIFGSFNWSIMEMNLVKGCVEYDINQIAKSSVLSKMKNYYIYLTDAPTNQIWNNMYNGRVIKMIQRTSDIQFEMFNVTQNNFIRFQIYLNTYINNIKKHNLIPPTKSVSRGVIKKIKLLQETDPELYDLRKHGSKRLYTVLCQEKRQPIVSLKNHAGAIEYMNYTTGKNIYYYCDSNEHPVMSFISGVHPKGYCLPCCKKKMPVEGTDTYKEHNSCVNTGTVEKSLNEDEKPSYNANRHIIAFGKPLPKYRLGYAPKETTDFISSIIGDDAEHSMYMYGVDQDYPGALGSSGAGVLAALALIKNVKPAKLADNFIKHLKIMGIGYESLMNGLNR